MKHFINAKPARDSFLKGSEYLSMKINWDHSKVWGKQTLKDYKRCRGVLKKKQPDVMIDFDEILINNKHYMTLLANSKFGICYTPCNITCITMQL